VEGTKRIAAGATKLGLAPTELELAALVEAVDDMAGRIAEGRRRLLSEKQVMERIVENVTSGVVSVDHLGRVVMGNHLAMDLLGIEVGDDLLGATRSVESLAPLAEFLEATGDILTEASVRLAFGEDDERNYRVVWVPIPDSKTPAALFVLEDSTEVLRAERLEAWAEMARIIAHEIKNPLTPIRLSTEHMREVWKRRPDHFAEVFERCTENILGQVEELQQIAMEFSTYSHIPRLDRQPGDLVAAVRSLAEVYAAAPERGIEVVFRGPREALIANFDDRLLRRAVRNLIENALRASGADGRLEVGIERDGETARISVADSGPGVEPELLLRIFDPYFSTHDTGTGLGLPIARRVAEEHDGSIAAANHPQGGLVVTITIPLS
jgi:two-component system nitrogen regulation sensor histidine kinase NtrY